jgi:hypothetical protein
VGKEKSQRERHAFLVLSLFVFFFFFFFTIDAWGLIQQNCTKTQEIAIYLRIFFSTLGNKKLALCLFFAFRPLV